MLKACCRRRRQHGGWLTARADPAAAGTPAATTLQRKLFSRWCACWLQAAAVAEARASRARAGRGLGYVRPGAAPHSAAAGVATRRMAGVLEFVIVVMLAVALAVVVVGRRPVEPWPCSMAARRATLSGAGPPRPASAARPADARPAATAAGAGVTPNGDACTLIKAPMHAAPGHSCECCAVVLDCMSAAPRARRALRCRWMPACGSAPNGCWRPEARITQRRLAHHAHAQRLAQHQHVAGPRRHCASRFGRSSPAPRRAGIDGCRPPRWVWPPAIGMPAAHRTRRRAIEDAP